MVTSPGDGEVLASRTVTVTGTGTAGGTVNVLLGSDRFGPYAVVAADGTWSVTGTFAADAIVDQTLRITQVVGGAGRGDIAIQVVLPAVAVVTPIDPTTPVTPTTPVAPAVTAPVNSGSDLAFTGATDTAGFIGLGLLLTLAGGALLLARRVRVGRA